MKGDGQAQCLLCGRVIAIRYQGQVRIHPRFASLGLDAVRSRHCPQCGGSLLFSALNPDSNPQAPWQTEVPRKPPPPRR
ncbi:MAG TPA: hypothetical protein VKZ60_13435 [Chloroflexota bacterium]|jgi:hypothetical protein|nr:hypothetical protein [Chloroflexota bacterium]